MDDTTSDGKRDIGYETTRGICPASYTGFKPSVAACKQRKCKELIEEEYQGIHRKICNINNRIPGNLARCPLEILNSSSSKED